MSVVHMAKSYKEQRVPICGQFSLDDNFSIFGIAVTCPECRKIILGDETENTEIQNHATLDEIAATLARIEKKLDDKDNPRRRIFHVSNCPCAFYDTNLGESFREPAKPKTRYDWSKAPKEATFGVVSGRYGAFWMIGSKTPPVLNGEGWIIVDLNDHWLGMDHTCILDASGDWRDSLERRPE